MSQSSPLFGAKPEVLRCSRCGKFVDWEDAHLQIVCHCRPQLELPPVMVREATDADRLAARALFQRDFGRRQIVAFGEPLDIDLMPALVAIMRDDPAGALAYRQYGDGLHIVALATDPMWQRSGVGGYLVAEAELLARRLGLVKMVVSTTNDNLPSLYFYQRRGYRLTAVLPGRVAELNGAPIKGFAGIQVCDEIRLEKVF